MEDTTVLYNRVANALIEIFLHAKPGHGVPFEYGNIARINLRNAIVKELQEQFTMETDEIDNQWKRRVDEIKQKFQVFTQEKFEFIHEIEQSSGATVNDLLSKVHQIPLDFESALDEFIEQVEQLDFGDFWK